MNELNQDFYHCIARERFERIRAEMERIRLLRDLRPARRPLRVALGQVLMAIGRWIVGPVPDWTENPRGAAPATSTGRDR
jgi:hypothetical protein